ncbi:MAG: TFIIB-type zinc ribbon-containing protein [Candidatus Xenobia bacterium]
MYACVACRGVALKHYVDHVDGGGVYACEACWGLWFDGHTLHDFLHSRRLKTRFIISEATEPLESVGYTIDTHVRRCPKCRVELESGVHAGVEIDACRRCQGLWFDAGDLERVMEAHEKHKHGLQLVDSELDLAEHQEHPSLVATAAASLPGKVSVEVRHAMEAIAHFLHRDHS